VPWAVETERLPDWKGAARSRRLRRLLRRCGPKHRCVFMTLADASLKICPEGGEAVAPTAIASRPPWSSLHAEVMRLNKLGPSCDGPAGPSKSASRSLHERKRRRPMAPAFRDAMVGNWLNPATVLQISCRWRRRRMPAPFHAQFKYWLGESRDKPAQPCCLKCWPINM